MSTFPHSVITSYADATVNLEQLRQQGVVGLEVPVEDLGDLTTNFEQLQTQLKTRLPHVPPLSFEDVTANFEHIERI